VAVVNLEDITLAQAVLLLGGVGALFEAVRRAWPRARDFVLFMTDLMGTPERNGKPAKPGLMRVVSDLVDSHDAHAAAMGEVRGQLAEVRADQVDNAARLTRVEEGVAAAASAAVTANDKADHMLTDLVEVKSQLGDVVSAQQTLAAEQAQIRSAVEQWRHSTEDQTGSTEDTQEGTS
jgi:hypothetical protein